MTHKLRACRESRLEIREIENHFNFLTKLSMNELIGEYNQLETRPCEPKAIANKIKI